MKNSITLLIMLAAIDIALVEFPRSPPNDFWPRESITIARIMFKERAQEMEERSSKCW